MTVLAAIRPDEFNLPLFVHVIGAFLMVGALVTAAAYLFAARRDGSIELTRTGFRTLLYAALPALIVTRIGAQWVSSEEGLTDADLTWMTIGFVSTDVGVLALISATIAAGIAVRKAETGRGIAIAAWLAVLLIVVYAVVIWLMAAKPS